MSLLYWPVPVKPNLSPARLRQTPACADGTRYPPRAGVSGAALPLQPQPVSAHSPAPAAIMATAPA